MLGLNHDTVHGIAPVAPEDRRTTNMFARVYRRFV
jgi:hypothetical protein